MNEKKLKKYLDSLYKKYHKKYSSGDPVWILHGLKQEDIEISAFITSCYCYGRVGAICNFISKFLDITGNKVYEFTSNYSERKDKKFIDELKYRFNSADDFSILLSRIRNILIKHGSLENYFIKGYSESHVNVLPALKEFSSAFRCGSSDPFSFGYLVPDVNAGSACKRLNLFLRWMIRKDNIDFGLWKGADTSKLIMPLDTHVFRVSRMLSLSIRKSCDMKFAEEITEKLKKFDPCDPVKYDFALCHIGIEGELLG
ncbi:MAG TPA: TIGR02757 family protein [Ignavibacteria bacterium]|mgnify:CR=1 FL=1|nr:TIGR02757 family protein [Ignavibacteria bacterium]HRJ98981.1 TIGR02757 family protein [Ignavibacteria bacterium]